jgi:hypothetical protein
VCRWWRSRLRLREWSPKVRRPPRRRSAAPGAGLLRPLFCKIFRHVDEFSRAIRKSETARDRRAVSGANRLLIEASWRSTIPRGAGVEPSGYEPESARQSDDLRSRAVAGEHRRHCCSPRQRGRRALFAALEPIPHRATSRNSGSCGFMLVVLLELLARRTDHAATLSMTGVSVAFVFATNVALV